MPNLNNQGYMGLTARNSDRYVKDLELNSIKIMNLDPRFYRHEGETTRDEELVATGQEERTEGAVYTDEMYGTDLIEMAELE